MSDTAEMTDREFVDWVTSPERGNVGICPDDFKRLASIADVKDVSALGVMPLIARLRLDLADRDAALAKIRSQVC